jgi:C4-dicarboxylate transporter DctQ subunit
MVSDQPSLRNEYLFELEKNFEGYIGILILAVYLFIQAVNIIQRWILGTQFSWALTVTLGLFTWMCWLTAAWAIRRGAHFRFTLFRSKLSNTTNYYLHYLDTLLWIIIASIISYTSIGILIKRINQGNTIIGTSIPRYLTYAAVPVGFLFILTRSIQKLYLIRKKYKNGENIIPDASIR